MSCNYYYIDSGQSQGEYRVMKKRQTLKDFLRIQRKSAQRERRKTRTMITLTKASVLTKNIHEVQPDVIFKGGPKMSFKSLMLSEVELLEDDQIIAALYSSVD